MEVNEIICIGGVDSHFDDCYVEFIETLEKLKMENDYAQCE